MGLRDLFGGKSRAAEQERILEEQKTQEHQNAVDAQKKEHENLPWPTVPRLNILNIKDSNLLARLWNGSEQVLNAERTIEVYAYHTNLLTLSCQVVDSLTSSLCS